MSIFEGPQQLTKIDELELEVAAWEPTRDRPLVAEDAIGQAVFLLRRVRAKAERDGVNLASPLAILQWLNPKEADE